jgi:hypothetical protein
MKSTNILKLAVARPRGARIAAAMIAACGAALAATGAQAAGYSFQTINDPADSPPPSGAGGLTFTNLMGMTSNGDTIPGLHGSGQAGDPNTGFVLTLPGKTFSADNASFPGLSFNAAQTQVTAVNGNGTTFTGYTYPTNLGWPSISSSASTSRAGVPYGQQPEDPGLQYGGRLRSRRDNRKPVDRRK